MKFQNCILINFELMHRRTDGRTDKPKAICPFNFSKVGGIINCLIKDFVADFLWKVSLKFLI